MKTLTATIANSMGTWEIELREDGTAAVVKFDPAPVRPAMRGLGDVVAAVTTAVGIKPCGGCKQRQAALNRLVPFAGAETPPAASEQAEATPTRPDNPDAA